MKSKTIRLAVLGAAAAVAIAGAHVAPSWAYFTANSEAEGGLTIQVEPTTSIDETVEGGAKHVTISNSANSAVPVFVRARVFANAEYLANGTPSGEGWTRGSDGYWYYTSPVEPGATTNELLVQVAWPDFDGEGEAVDHTGENFNIIVVYEATPVQYDNDGNLVDPMSSACDWDLATEE